MEKGKTLVKSIYGSIALMRGFCPLCQKFSIILDLKYQCCDSPIEDFENQKIKRMIEGEIQRSRLLLHEKEEILENQENKCFYCDCDLENSWYIKKKMTNPRPIKIHFDHVIPWAYSRATIMHGMVATCHICNGIKGSKYFTDELEAREYIKNRRDEKGIIIL